VGGGTVAGWPGLLLIAHYALLVAFRSQQQAAYLFIK
jgi:hypothetical protein